MKPPKSLQEKLADLTGLMHHTYLDMCALTEQIISTTVPGIPEFPEKGMLPGVYQDIVLLETIHDMIELMAMHISHPGEEDSDVTI